MDFEILSIRGVSAAIILALLWGLEVAWPLIGARARRGEHYARNIVLGIVNALIVAVLFSAGLLLASEFAREQSIGLLNWVTLPVVLQWVLAIILFDAWQYAWHVMNHRVPLLWRFHAVHHSDAEMDASTALRFHTGEIALSALARMAVLPVLGLSMVQLAVYELLLLPIIMFHHSNVAVPAKLDRRLRAVIVTPWMHWVHHSDYRPETDSNYSSIFSVWDRVFGTFRLRDDLRQIQIGLKGFQDAEWRPLRGIIAIPFIHKFIKAETITDR